MNDEASVETIDEASMNAIIKRVESERYYIDLFRKSTASFFEEHPDLTQSRRIVHSVKSRMKNWDRLREKIQRKWSSEDSITSDNVFDQITDIAGVRVLHLYQDQFPQIHEAIIQRVDDEYWTLHEDPRAYTWDPESRDFFTDLGLEVEMKESFYTSIHYVIRPKEGSNVSCEIQVRTLFEEIWGEIDHLVKYSESTVSVACQEQIGVLARLVGAGSRLADSIWRTYSDEKKAQEDSN